jgi:WD40 repeat protein
MRLACIANELAESTTDWLELSSIALQTGTRQTIQDCCPANEATGVHVLQAGGQFVTRRTSREVGFAYRQLRSARDGSMPSTQRSLSASPGSASRGSENPVPEVLRLLAWSMTMDLVETPKGRWRRRSRSMSSRWLSLLAASTLALAVVLIPVLLAKHRITAEEFKPPPSPPNARAMKEEADNPEGRDCYGDPLPEDAIARFGTLRLRHDYPLESVALSPDGSLVASVDMSGAVRIWHADSGSEVARFADKISARAIAFSADGSKLLACGGRSSAVQEWDVKHATLLRELKSDNNAIWNSPRVIISPDQRVVAAMPSGYACGVYDLNGANALLRLKENNPGFTAVAFTHDGKTLATAGAEAGIRLWDIASSRQLRQLASPNGVSAMEFSPDDGTLAVAAGTLCVIDVTRGKQVYRSPEIAVGRPVYSPDGTILAAGAGELVHIWDTKTWRETKRLRGTAGARIDDLAISTDGRRLAAGRGAQVVQVWDIASGHKLVPGEGQCSPVLSVSVSPDGKTLVSGGADGFLSIWDGRTGRLRHRIEGHAGSVFCTAISPDGRTAATGDGHRGTGGNASGEVRVWDLSTGTLVWRRAGHRNGVYSVAFSPDGQSLASGGGDEAVRLWDARTGNEQSGLPVADRWGVSTLSFSKDGKTLVVGRPFGEIKCIALPTGESTAPPAARRGLMFTALLPDGKWVVSATRGPGEGEVRLSSCDARPGECKVFPFPRLRSCTISPDGQLLVVAEDGQPIRVREIASGRTLFELRGHRGQVAALAFSADCKLLASASSDTTALLWSLAQAKLNNHWRDLDSENDNIANSAADALVRIPNEAAPYLVGRLQRAAALEARAARLIPALGDDGFERRENATQQLHDLGPEVEFALARALRRNPSAEIRRRLTELIWRFRAVGKQASPALPEQLTKKDLEAMFHRPVSPPNNESTPATSTHERALRRALQLLARMPTAEAHKALAALASGDQNGWLTQQAKLLQPLVQQGHPHP